MTHSESIKEIAAALARAQGAMELAKKSEANPFFKSKYADLAEIWDVIRKPLSDHGLSVAQGASSAGPVVKCSTLLMHVSGEWIEDVLEMTVADPRPQTIGSGITYARRYGIQAMVGVAAEKDDDGNEAQGNEKVADGKARAKELPTPRQYGKAQEKRTPGQVLADMFGDELVSWTEAEKSASRDILRANDEKAIAAHLEERVIQYSKRKEEALFKAQ